MPHAASYPGKILGASIFLLTALASLPGCSHYSGVENLIGPEPKTTEYDVVEGLVYTPENWPQALSGGRRRYTGGLDQL